MKYIVVKDEFGTEQPIVSSEILSHKNIAQGRSVISADFCKFYPEGDKITASVWGDSFTLKVKSRPEDAELIERMMRF